VTLTFSDVTVRILCSQMSGLVIDMLDLGQNLSKSRAIATKFVSDNNLRLILKTIQQPLEELLGCFLVTPVCDKDVEFDAVLDQPRATGISVHPSFLGSPRQGATCFQAVAFFS